MACTFLTTIGTLATGVGSVYIQRRLGEIKRLDLASLAGDAPGAVMNVLLVGSDSRAGPEGADAANLGKDQVPGQRSDTIMILHVDPRARTAAIVSVPRDLYLPIVGGGPDRVNAAFATGGADRLIATLHAALGVTINHYVQVDFSGFKDIVDAVGGVTLYIPYPVRDTVSGLALERPGCVSLDGDQALAWVRSRQAQFLVNGVWQSDGRGDLGRIERQQEFVHRMIKKALSTGIGNPIRLNRLIGVGVRDVTFDSTLSTEDISALGRRFSSLDPDKVALSTLPTSPVDIAGKAVLALQAGQAQPMLDLLNGKVATVAPPPGIPGSSIPASSVPGSSIPTPAGAAPNPGGGPSAAPKAADVRVRVLNGVGSPGAASKAATSLTSAGFTIADKGDAPAISAKTSIMYGAGQLAKAQLLQASLVAPAVLKEDATLKAVDVNLVLGGDFAGVKSGISSGTSSASTTVPALKATTTTMAAQIAPSTLPRSGATPPC